MTTLIKFKDVLPGDTLQVDEQTVTVTSAYGKFAYRLGDGSILPQVTFDEKPVYLLNRDGMIPQIPGESIYNVTLHSGSKYDSALCLPDGSYAGERAGTYLQIFRTKSVKEWSIRF